MNVHFTILLTVEIVSVFTEIHASPGRWWGSTSKHKYWNRHGSGRVNICSSGECVQAWKCPKSAVSNHSSDHCNHWNNGAMVCCVLNNLEGDNFSETFIFNKHSKSTEIPNIQNNFQSDFNQGNRISTKSVDVHWKRKSWDQPISFSSYGDVFEESREKMPSTPRFNSNNVPDRTTISWNKPRTSDFRVVFPTESVWLSRTTRHPTYTTRKFKTSSDSKITKSWMLPSTIPTAATSSYFTKNTRKTTPGYVFTTRKLDRTSSSGYTKSWVTRSTTTVAPTFSTKYPMQPVSKTDFFTKTWNRATDYKSTKLWPTRSTTVSRLGYPSKTTRTAVFRPTDFPAKPTEYDKVTMQVTSSKPDNNRRQEWDKSTPTSTRNQSTKRTSTSNPKTTRSSTRRYRVTTPLPNVNTHLCGIRDERSNGNRGRRNNEKKYDVSDDKTYSSRSPSSWQHYQRIVGGEEVEPFSWPWVAALYKVTSPNGNRFLCAGSLINKNFVLTAAHVFTPDDLRTVSYFVMLGTHNAQDAVAQYLVSSILRHPRYENRYYYYDIALLKLVKPVTFNNYVMPVCLPSPDAPLLRDRDLEGKNVTVMGWGDESFGGVSSRVLKEATFPVVSRSLCNASYVRVASNRFPKGITDGMLCAGDPNGGKDACQGDSGGPLLSIESGRYTQVGIVSFGYQCGDKEFPGVYTKVAPFVSWIAENTLNNEDYETGDYDYY